MDLNAEEEKLNEVVERLDEFLSFLCYGLMVYLYFKITTHIYTCNV